MTRWKQALAISGLAIAAVGATGAAFADSKAAIDQNVSDSLKLFYSKNPKHRDIANQAVGMLVFPRITKAGVGVGGEYGQGALRIHGKNVAYYSLGGGSLGATLGASTRSEIIMFMNQASLDKFMASKGWTVGADAGIALVSEGAGGDLDTKTLQKPIVGFVFDEKGIMADLSLDGSKITEIQPSG
jgi:lipid-binding SYLF domain-containing protein